MNIFITSVMLIYVLDINKTFHIFLNWGFVMLKLFLWSLILINVMLVSILIIKTYKNPNLMKDKLNMGLLLLQIILIIVNIMIQII